MDVTLARFVAALRRADLRVSPAETLDALAVVNCIGVGNPELLRDALELTLAKTQEEKRHFAECFARFFEQLAFKTPAKQSFFRGVDRSVAVQRLEPFVGGTALAVAAGIFKNDQGALAFTVEHAAPHAA